MLAWNQLHQDLESATNRHRQLAAKFEQFAKFVAEQVAAPAFHIKGIGISLNLDQGFFSTTFAGRTLHYTFESVPSGMNLSRKSHVLPQEGISYT